MLRGRFDFERVEMIGSIQEILCLLMATKLDCKMMVASKQACMASSDEPNGLGGCDDVVLSLLKMGEFQ